MMGKDFLEYMELSEEWEKVFGEPLKEGPMITSDVFPILRECLAQKSKAPMEVYVKAELDSGKIF